MCLAYLNDILVFGGNFWSIAGKLQAILIEKKNAIKFRIWKCDMFKQLVRYLGLMVSIEGYEVNPHDDAALETSGKTSESVRESQLLLAFLRQYQSYRKKFSVILKPVGNVLKVKKIFFDKKSPRWKR